MSEHPASLPAERRAVVGKLRSFVKKHLPKGCTLDMEKARLRFKSLDDIPLDVVGEVIAGKPVEAYVETYRSSRARGPASARKQMRAGYGEASPKPLRGEGGAKGARGAEGAGAKSAKGRVR